MPNMLSEYLTTDDFKCHHCGLLPPDIQNMGESSWPQMYDVLFADYDDFVKMWGSKIPPTSGYRCPDHEFEVSGSRLSPHIFGALDLGITADKHSEFVQMVNNIHPEVRLGTNNHPDATHVHFDVCFMLVPRYSTALAKSIRWVE
jgi:hypothetical protein